MVYIDKQLSCADCGADFRFSSSEQERYAQLGFTEDPKRCPSCRGATKPWSGAVGPAPRTSSGREGRAPGIGPMLYPAVCSNCGKPTAVPFHPRGNRSVYCSDCFNRRR